MALGAVPQDVLFRAALREETAFDMYRGIYITRLDYFNPPLSLGVNWCSLKPKKAHTPQEWAQLRKPAEDLLKNELKKAGYM